MEIETGTVFRFAHTFKQIDFDQFAALSGDDNPIHVDPEFAARTKFGRTVAHGMLLYSVICSGLFKGFPNNMQITQELMFPSPTFVGEEVVVRLEVLGTDREQGTTNICTTIARPSVELSCQGQTTIVNLSNARSSDLAAITENQPKHSKVRSWKGLNLGQSASIERIFILADLYEYANVSDDRNPLYTDSDYAKGFGFDGALIPGGLLGGMFSCLLGTQLPGRGTNWLKQETHFHAPAYPNQTLFAKVEITRLRPEKDLVNLRTRITNSKNMLVCSGEALVLVKDLAV